MPTNDDHDDRTHDPVPVPDEPVTGVGTDGSLDSADVLDPDIEPATGVGTDGSLSHDRLSHDHVERDR